MLRFFCEYAQKYAQNIHVRNMYIFGDGIINHGFWVNIKFLNNDQVFHFLQRSKINIQQML